MKGIGLVFAGGGGKGAYEIGVWKYLHEVGLEQYVRATSGTSVGALNAALFVGASYEIAEDLWLNITPKKILSPKKITPQEVIYWLGHNGLKMSNSVTQMVGSVTTSMAKGVGTIAQAMLTKLYVDNLFSRDGLISLIENGLNFSLLQESDVPCFATCLRCPNLQIERFKLNDYIDSEITQLLLASSAIPVIFPNEKFNGNRYCDGGVPFVGDNIPIQPVYDMGVENIIVVHLSQDCVINKALFPNSRIIEIVPSVDLGNALTGTLDFTANSSEKRIQLGYEDTKRVMQPMIEMILMNVENQMILKAAQKSNVEFEEKKEKLKKEETKIKKSMLEDDFQDVYDELISRGE